VTDYAPPIAPLDWVNSYSLPFIDLLSLCAAAAQVVLWDGSFQVWADSALASRAKRLMTRELAARLNTGSRFVLPNHDQLLTEGDQYGQAIADDFATRSTAAPYRFMAGAIARFSVPVVRNGVPDVPEFKQVDAVGLYYGALNGVLAAYETLMADFAAQATANSALDPTSAATASAAVATARANYVTQLQAAYPNRGYA
jgi:hypothetical protein